MKNSIVCGVTSVLVALVLWGCAAPIENAGQIADKAGLEMRRFETGFFEIVGFHRPGKSRSGRLTIVIEGDGRGWRNRFTPPADPSPKDAVGLLVAAAHPASGALLYLARPCQFTGTDRDRCHLMYWTDWRFHPDAVAALNNAIDQYVENRAKPPAITLIGHSGGGVMAVLIAAQRSDVVRVITMAAPLDIEAWVKEHDLSPLEGSLSPMERLDPLKAIAQTHLVGEDDERVPALIVHSYARALGPEAPVEVRVVPDQDHDCCWAEEWPRLFISLR